VEENEMKTLVRRSGVPHSTRPELRPGVNVCHVVLRIRRGLPWLRTPKTYRVLERAFRVSKEKQGFRLVQYSVQRDHLHLLVEAENKLRLARAMQGLEIRVAKALNRYWRRRLGSVFADRYFARALENYRQIKRALCYVVNNARKHGVWSSKDQPDPFSSGRWYDGWYWHQRELIRRPLRDPPVARAKDYYLTLSSFRDFSVTFVPGQRAWESESFEALLAT
jgi:REP element-mobilizing transposase RayT